MRYTNDQKYIQTLYDLWQWGPDSKYLLLFLQSNVYRLFLKEPGTNEEIKAFAAKYNAQFDMFAKINVNGNDADGLWNYLKNKQGGTFGK